MFVVRCSRDVHDMKRSVVPRAGAGKPRVRPADSCISPARAVPVTLMKFLWIGALALFACSSSWAGESPIWRGPVSGAVTPQGAWIKAKLRTNGASARLLVSHTVELAAPQFFGPDTAVTERGQLVEFRPAGLEPNTQYFYGLEVNGVLQLDKRGAFKTFPPADQPASFNFAFASCGRTGSASPVYATIRELRPLFYVNAGDLHYENITTNNRTLFRIAFDKVLASPTQSALYRAVPFVYVWDDHDFGGNNSNRKASSHGAARRTYEEYIPHYPFVVPAEDGPIGHTFTVGRVKFIVTDLRSERDEAKKPDGPGKTMLGAPQKAWFKNELLAARGKYPLIFWVSSVPWLGAAGVNYYPINGNVTGFIHHTNAWQFKRDPATAEDNRNVRNDDDFWGAFAFERNEIANFIRDQKITGLCILHGDAHMLAADDGSHSDFATGGGAPVPVLCAAPLDQSSSIKGGPYSQGVYKAHPKEGCFGYVQVRDEGGKIEVRFSGRNQFNEEKISLKFSMPTP